MQFIHPGGEHYPDKGDEKNWNSGDHGRKFLKSSGRCLYRGQLVEEEVVFWGEWEPESRVVERYADPVPDGPHFLYEPFALTHEDEAWRQNTDPFAFGSQFLYTGCMQQTRRGPTQLRYLRPGSMVLFGSCLQKARFVIDTVFVVGASLDHSALDWNRRLAGRVPDLYRAVTLEPWYWGSTSAEPTYRLYFGATPESPVGEMFSFFPCRRLARGNSAFARPTIDLAGLITPNLPQGKKIAYDLGLIAMQDLWRRVVSQVEGQGDLLGTFADLPRFQTAAANHRSF